MSLSESSSDQEMLGLDSEWSGRNKRQTRRRLVLSLYTLVLFGCAIAYVSREWNRQQLEHVLQWSLVFLSPALIGWAWQRFRRQLTIWDGGELHASFATRKPRDLPGWLVSGMWLVATAAPLGVLFFRESDALVVMSLAFVGAILATIAWLWFDGHPTEVRELGLVLDGVHLFSWNSIFGVAATSRADVIEFQSTRPVEVFVCPDKRTKLLQLIDSKINATEIAHEQKR